MKPIYIHSGMAGAPQYANADGNINAILEACLVNGFNSKTATSASASGGVLTLNFAADPLFEPLQTVELAVSSVALVNGQHRVIANTNNQVTIAIPGLPDGAVGSSGAGITIKQAGAGWSKPFSNSTVAVFRPPAGNRRYLRCEHAINAQFLVRAFTLMTGSDDDGENPFPNVSQAVNLVGVYNGFAQEGGAWFIVASDRWMVFTLGNANLGNSYGTGYVFFGDLIEGFGVDGSKNTCLAAAYGAFMLSYDNNFTSVATNVAEEQAATWSNFNKDYTKFIPYVRVIQGDSVMRGILPNFYKMSVEAQNSDFLKVFENIEDLDGRVRVIMQGWYASARIAIACDEDVWQ